MGPTSSYDWALDNGIPSILDITHTADIPKFCAAVPLSTHRLLKIFGTMTPSRAQVDAVLAAGGERPGDDVRRWEATYFIVHDESGAPTEYVVVGYSGD